MRSAEGMGVEKAANHSRQRRIQNVFWTLGLGGHRFMMASLESTQFGNCIEQTDVSIHQLTGVDLLADLTH